MNYILIMTKEQIAKKLAKELYHQPMLCKLSMEVIILKELTSILQADKGTLTKGTIQ